MDARLGIADVGQDIKALQKDVRAIGFSLIQQDDPAVPSEITSCAATRDSRLELRYNVCIANFRPTARLDDHLPSNIML
jgi:hypothetical protein